MKKKTLALLLFLILCVALSIPFQTRPNNVKLSEMLDGVVRIEVDGWHTGSGFIVDDSGLIITAKHVVDRAGSYSVVFTDGAKRKVQGIRMSEKSDCAVLSVFRKNLHALELSTEVKVGQPVFVIGTPYDVKLTNYITGGIISKIGVAEEFFCITPLTMIDADANPGNSGGPVLNVEGKVIGIVVGGYGSGIGLGYVVSSMDFAELLEGWSDEGANWKEQRQQELKWAEEWGF